MHWTADGSLYARFKTWKFMCENILEAELDSLQYTKKIQILPRWSGDQGLQMYQGWYLEPSETSTEILW